MASFVAFLAIACRGYRIALGHVAFFCHIPRGQWGKSGQTAALMASSGADARGAISSLGNGWSIMRQDVSEKTGDIALFRKQAVRSASRRIFGPVTVAVPPSGMLALSITTIALTLLGLVAWCVEVPQRARAVGVLMPPDGLLEVVANAPGRVANIHVREGQVVEQGDLLLSIKSSDDGLARKKLQALRNELALLNEAHARQRAIDRNRLLAFDEQLASIDRRIALANEEYQLQGAQVRLLERRMTRRRELADEGSLSNDALDQEQSVLLQASARLLAMRHSVLEYEQRMSAIRQERQKASDESEHRDVMHALEHKRSEREIVAQEFRIDRQIHAQATGVVARVSVKPGAMVKAGDTLLKTFRPYSELEAWIYLSSARTGHLKNGQVVQLRFDAYPHQLFGTTDAVVTSVSKTAIVPWELKTPLALNGPVFEIRAKLDKSHIEAFEDRWPLVPGTSFRADIVQRRYKLYEWLLRSLAT
jgi:membrane fusion protein